MNAAFPRFTTALRLAMLSIFAIAGAAGPARAVSPPSAPHLETAVLAGGCFWGMDEVFEHVQGVTNVVSGYAGGSAQTAHYDEVSTGTTGHAESVAITYDPRAVSYRRLLDVYFTVAHDPTQLNRQTPDEGTQYRSAIFYRGDAQRRVALAAIAELTKTHRFSAPIVTQVVPLRGFYAAEAYHQHFAEKNPDYPYIVLVDAPKVSALREKFPDLVKKAG